MFIAEALLVLLAVMALFPDTSLGKYLRRTCVDAPARLLGERTFRQSLLAILSALAVAAVFLLAPELFALLATMGDVSVVIDVMIMVLALGVQSSVRNAFRRARETIAAVIKGLRWIVAGAGGLARARARRRRRIRRPVRPPDSDAEPGFALAWR